MRDHVRAEPVLSINVCGYVLGARRSLSSHQSGQAPVGRRGWGRLPLAMDGWMAASLSSDGRARHAQHEMPLQAWQSEAARRVVRSRMGGKAGKLCSVEASLLSSVVRCAAMLCPALLCSPARLRGIYLPHVGSSRVLQSEGRNLDREARDVGGWMYRVSKSDTVDGAMMMGQESSPARQ